MASTGANYVKNEHDELLTAGFTLTGVGKSVKAKKNDTFYKMVKTQNKI